MILEQQPGFLRKSRKYDTYLRIDMAHIALCIVNLKLCAWKALNARTK